MANSGLIDAFNDCIDRLHAGASLDDCLAAYPQYARELRALLETGTAVRRAAPPVPLGAKARVYAQVMQAASHVETPRRSFLPVSRLAAAAAVAVAILVVALVANWLKDDDERLGTVPIPSATATVTPVAPTRTATVTGTPTATAQPTQTPSPTRTLSPTPTASLTPTPTITASPSPTPTACVVTSPAGWTEYGIQSGDSLSSIAAARNTSVDELQRVNCLPDPNLITPGQTILVPALAPPAATSPPPPAQQAPVVPTAPPPAPGSGPEAPDDDDDD